MNKRGRYAVEDRRERPMVQESETMRMGESDPCISLSRQRMGVPVHNDRRLFEMLILEGRKPVIVAIA